MSIKFTIDVTPQASRDIQEIFTYISNELNNSKAAKDTIDKVLASLGLLETFPYSCPCINLPGLPVESYRKCISGNYIAIYKVNTELQTVTVIKVFYGARDYKNLGLI